MTDVPVAGLVAAIREAINAELGDAWWQYTIHKDTHHGSYARSLPQEMREAASVIRGEIEGDETMRSTAGLASLLESWAADLEIALIDAGCVHPRLPADMTPARLREIADDYEYLWMHATGELRRLAPGRAAIELAAWAAQLEAH